ncbi:hypothetical protein CICLE_v10013940mg [Citrus x clementina]|uniref:O-fucosyltransferase family protein n=1 Tax=Citrus clementina TaxID=85681 RepID=V4WAD1_CITCL|nr:hypothetical protein CICLE_v10013940mg [Citrus x clementina]
MYRRFTGDNIRWLTGFNQMRAQLLVDRMRSYCPHIALHLRYEKDACLRWKFYFSRMYPNFWPNSFELSNQSKEENELADQGTPRSDAQEQIVDARTHDLFPIEADELRAIRENTANWKVKEIDSKEPTSNGYCSLNPKEVGIFLTALGYPSSTSIYIAAAEIYDGDARMVDLQSYYPIMMSKVLLVSYMLASVEKLEPFVNHASQMAALN